MHASVVIVGAGPVGLLLACELGTRRVPVILIEEKGALVHHPKANTQSARSMEIYRRHGISDRLRANGMPPDRPTDIAYFTRLFRHELHRVPMPSSLDAEAAVRAGDPRWPTPEPQLRITQMVIEPVLLERARSFASIDVRFGVRAVGLEQNADSVRLTVEHVRSGERQDLVADYAVGCDGGRSLVRKALGVRFLGEGGLEMDFLGGPMLATYFRAPTLLPRFPHADTWMHWIMHPKCRSILLVIDPVAHEFLLHFQLKPEQKAEDIDFASRLAMIIGEPIPHEILSSAVWRAGVGLVAERYSVGRCFLAGDAVHLFTPTGGFGLNTGIEDAANLGWKLGAVCRGIAAPALLDSYEVERRPIGLRNTRYALQLAQRNGACPVSDILDDESSEGEAARMATTAHLARFARWEFDTPGVQLGARYDGSPLIAPDSGVVPEDSPTLYVPCGVPGGRLPHVWLKDKRSLFDRLGPEFTLIRLSDAGSDEAWRAAANALGIDLTILWLDEPDLAAVIAAECALVRPDQHIAWRGSGPVRDPQAILRRAAGWGAGVRRPLN